MFQTEQRGLKRQERDVLRGITRGDGATKLYSRPDRSRAFDLCPRSPDRRTRRRGRSAACRRGSPAGSDHDDRDPGVRARPAGRARGRGGRSEAQTPGPGFLTAASGGHLAATPAAGRSASAAGARPARTTAGAAGHRPGGGARPGPAGASAAGPGAVRRTAGRHGHPPAHHRQRTRVAVRGLGRSLPRPRGPVHRRWRPSEAAFALNPAMPLRTAPAGRRAAGAWRAGPVRSPRPRLRP
jgi:hypothetical protein